MQNYSWKLQICLLALLTLGVGSIRARYLHIWNSWRSANQSVRVRLNAYWRERAGTEHWKTERKKSWKICHLVSTSRYMWRADMAVTLIEEMVKNMRKLIISREWEEVLLRKTTTEQLWTSCKSERTTIWSALCLLQEWMDYFLNRSVLTARVSRRLPVMY